MKKFIVSLSLVVVLLFTMGSITACEKKADEPVVLKLASTLSGPQVALLEEMVEKFNQRAEGTNYSIELYPGGALSSQEETLDMVREGAIEIGEIGMATAATYDLRLGAAEGVPFLLDDIHAIFKFTEIIGDELFSDILEEDFNQKLLSANPNPPLYWCGAKPVKTLEDWDGLMIHVMTSLQGQTVEAFGASAVSLPFFDVVPSMEKGVIDGSVNFDTYVIYMMNCFDSFKSVTVADIFGGVVAFTINLDVFNDMPDNVKEILLEEFEQYRLAGLDYTLSNVIASEQACIDHGVEVYYLPKAERDRWAEAAQGVVDDFFEQLDPDDVDIILEAAEEANSG
jgi:TRAP-type C4-dicarboxylate transport system substrate-binding protein